MKILRHHVIALRNELARKLSSRKRKVFKKPAAWLYPDLIQKRYSNELSRDIGKVWMNIIEQQVFPALPAIMEDMSIKFDSEMELVVDKTRGMFISVINAKAPQAAGKFARETSKFNQQQGEKVIKSATSADIPLLLPANTEDAVMRQFISENVRLIKGLADDVAKKLEERTYSGVRKGYNAKELQKSIQYRFGIDSSIFKTIKTRMELIAEDQIGKLNGQLTQLRQEIIGVTKYTWRTMGDERVRGNPRGFYPSARPSHWDREGKVYKWAKPPIDGHPGTPIRCRCYAEPVLEDLTK
jgi:SPP1 gp7 family putative phage head morphogenesis protein